MVLSVAEGYRLWASTYGKDHNPVVALEERICAGLHLRLRPRIMLDVACGTGRSMNGCLTTDAITLGIDSSFEMLREAQRHTGGETTVAQADAAQLPFGDGCADLTVCSLALSYFTSLDLAVSELARVTRRNGHVLISDLHPDAIANGWTRGFRLGAVSYQIDHRTYSEDELRAALDRNSLEIETQQDAAFGEPERQYFIAAGRTDLFSKASNTPAIRVTLCARS